MKKLLVLLTAIGGIFAFLRRRQSAEQGAASFDWPPPPEPRSMETVSGVGEAPTGSADPAGATGGMMGGAPSASSEASDLTTAPASEMDPERREQESRHTGETRYDRLTEAESAERHARAQEVAEDLDSDVASRKTADDDK